MMRKENFLSGIIVFSSAAILSAFTAVSLIFFEVADYVYLNIAGLFIFCVYFGFVPSVFLSRCYCVHNDKISTCRYIF